MTSPDIAQSSWKKLSKAQSLRRPLVEKPRVYLRGRPTLSYKKAYEDFDGITHA